MHLRVTGRRRNVLVPDEELKAEKNIQLWKLACEGDPSALEALLRSHQDLIFRFSLSQLWDKSIAVEATQETATRLIDKLTSFSGKGKLSTWVLGIANNVCREIRRKENKWKQLHTHNAQLELSEPEGTNSLELIEERQSLNWAISQLPDRQREAVVLRYFESLSVSETAEVMQVAVGTVKASLNQALKKLRVELEHIHDQ